MNLDSNLDQTEIQLGLENIVKCFIAKWITDQSAACTTHSPHNTKNVLFSFSHFKVYGRFPWWCGTTSAMAAVPCWMRAPTPTTQTTSSSSCGRTSRGITTLTGWYYFTWVQTWPKRYRFHFRRAPIGLFYHAAWFTQPHNLEGFERFLDTILSLNDVWFVTSWQSIQWMRSLHDPGDPLRFEPFQCNKKVRTVLLFCNLPVSYPKVMDY